MDAATAPAQRATSRKPDPWIPRAVFAACCLPLVNLAAGVALGRLGANPIERGLNNLGWWTLVLLFSSLACTPLQLVFGLKWPLRVRRTLGLFAFFYCALHFVTYAVLDQGLDFGAIWKDVVKRKFITVGFAAFVLLIPLAVTSTNKWMRRLGFARWKALHRLVYVIAMLGVIHFVWRVKKDHTEPILFAVVLGVLLGVRLLDRIRHPRPRKTEGNRSTVGA